MHQGVTTFKGKRDALLSSQLDKLRESTTTVINGLADLNLPGAIEALENPVTIPKVSQNIDICVLAHNEMQTLLDKAEDVRTSNGATSIQKKIEARRQYTSLLLVIWCAGGGGTIR